MTAPVSKEQLTFCKSPTFGGMLGVGEPLLPHVHHPDGELGDPEGVPGDGRLQLAHRLPQLHVGDAGRPEDISRAGGAPDRQRRERQ